MSWRYMAAVETSGGEGVWTIREFYDGRGWTARAVAPSGDTHAELREVLRMMTFDIEHRDFLDLDAGVVAHRPGGLRADLSRPGDGPLVPVLDADGLPAVTTVGDLTARHLGHEIDVEEMRSVRLLAMRQPLPDQPLVALLVRTPGGDITSTDYLDIDTTCELLP